MVLIVAILLSANSLISQSLEVNLQTIVDSIYKTNPEAIGIMVHVESPEKGISWSGASGYSYFKVKTKLDPEQPALIASSIKTYVSATILRLVEKGEISLELPIGPLLSDKTQKLFEKDGYNLTKIQIKHLLSHTS